MHPDRSRRTPGNTRSETHPGKTFSNVPLKVSPPVCYLDIKVGNDGAAVFCWKLPDRAQSFDFYFHRPGGALGYFWVGMCRLGLQIGTPF